MKYESGNLHNLPLNSRKKSYLPLKVSMLGSLTQLTQGNEGSRNDEGTGMNRGQGPRP